MGVGKICGTCKSEWCSVWTSLGIPHGYRTVNCVRCGKLKVIHVNRKTCDECIKPLLKALWGDEYDRIVTKPALKPFAEPVVSGYRRKNQGKGRRRY